MPGSRVFSSDNTAGASPEVLRAVAAASVGASPSYGADRWTELARTRLCEVFERDVDVIMTSTGSAANALALAALTPPWGSVLCHRSSHVTTDEAGAPEFFTNGAKLVGLGGDDARIDAGELAVAARRGQGDVHSVQPSALSITQATETGGVYSVDELEELAGIAKAAGLGVHLDGARIANAVAALGCSVADLTWRAGVDVVSFGATKNGTMTADALVVLDSSLTPQVRHRTKRAGQLPAKLRFHSAQVAAYLEDDLWLRNATHANRAADRLREGLVSLGLATPLDRPAANIVFCTLDPRVVEALRADGFAFYGDRWGPGVCRFVTSFETTDADVDDLLARLEAHG